MLHSSASRLPGYALDMTMRHLPLLCGLLPFAGVWTAWFLGIANGSIPLCNPFLDGCVSISATGRPFPGSLAFRASLLPQAALLVVLWILVAGWLARVSVAGRSRRRLVLAAGIVGALSLVVYTTYLGTDSAVYNFMRRFGIYGYFAGTIVAQLAVSLALRRSVGRISRGWQWLMLACCTLPFVMGIVNLALKALLTNSDPLENAIEWQVALLMQVWFVGLWVAWRQTGFAVSVEIQPADLGTSAAAKAPDSLSAERPSSFSSE